MYTDTKNNFNQDKTAIFKNVRMYPDRIARKDEGETNGCGSSDYTDAFNKLANKITGIKAACNNHDLCYENCGETHKSCDIEFRNVGHSICNKKHDSSVQQRLCKTVVDDMYKLVRKFGNKAFRRSQEKNCDQS